jgi:hypothetical protein
LHGNIVFVKLVRKSVLPGARYKSFIDIITEKTAMQLAKFKTLFHSFNAYFNAKLCHQVKLKSPLFILNSSDIKQLITVMTLNKITIPTVNTSNELDIKSHEDFTLIENTKIQGNV